MEPAKSFILKLIKILIFHRNKILTTKISKLYGNLKNQTLADPQIS